MRNANSGTIIITNGVTNSKIRPGDVIPKGWVRGKTQKTQLRRWINNGETEFLHNLDDTIPIGYSFGRKVTKRKGE